MSKWSPLERGDVFNAEMEHVQMAANMTRPSLRMGHAAHFGHDSQYAAVGWDCKPSASMAAFDREWLGHLHDDKTAGWVMRNGVLTTNELHYVTQQEFIVWENRRKEHDQDVIIHSLELVKPYVDGEPFEVRYMGACSWDHIRKWLKEYTAEDGTGSYSFERFPMVKWSPY